MWPSSATTRHVNYGLPPEFFVVTPASSFHHNTQHHHHHQEAATATTINFDSHGINSSNAAAAIGVGVIPLLTAAPCLNMGSTDEDLLSNTRNRSGSGMQLWQNQQVQNTSSYSKKPMIQDHSILLQTGSGGSSCGGGNGIGGSSSGAITCQDCGNQAKKDCSRRRCRTCCRSRGYDCATHLKSTWVPAARRRERLAMAATAATAGSSQSTSGAKKPRLGTSLTTTASHTSTSNNTPPRSFDTSSSHQGASFKEPLPGQVRAQAVFKCVKVTAVDDGDDEYAYQAVVRIGGHVFKGFLYDQGVEQKDGFPNISDLHLGGSSSGAGGGAGGEGRNVASSSSPVLDTPDAYAQGGGLLGGSNYGIPIN
ncbi:protein LATERAL ROOT PRIMORDIUM 1-like [Olea europaea var. sylvestris]|uniref:protein LATERAL ROOT PRIMORDIUM 1-like n=1 Tax=Olea europaea var. sylvestris TaxID=158386 RepID=UPI000C1CDA6F|nr:protein LATERAL ROOT PRIMORDIUM 1-like [Olea europaea var. sylvestris]